MADLKCIFADVDILLGSKTGIIASGNVTDGVNPLERTIIGYSYPIFNKPVMGASGSDGKWSINLSFSPADRYIVMVLGDIGENSDIYDYIGE